MDYDDDGVLDFISGSYDPGDLYFSRGLGHGEYAAVEKIRDESGLELVHHPKDMAKWNLFSEDEQQSYDEGRIQYRVASFGSWPTIVDWDGDGDNDILIGTFAGDLFLRINKGTRAEPVYDAKAVQVEAAGTPLHVNMHAAPNAVDWDLDGRWDLVVGSGDGAVGWFRNVGAADAPDFEGYRPLVLPAADSKFLQQNLKPGEEPTHRTRAQICVTDYDGDGMPDLLLGDYSDINWLRDLSESEQTRCDELKGKMDTAVATVLKLREKFAEDYQNEAFQAEMEQFQKVYEELESRRKKFFEESRSASFVWLFRRTRVLAESELPPPTVVKQPVNDVRATDQQALAERTTTDQLQLDAFITPVEDSPHEFDVSVVLAITEGWHLYADVPDGSGHTKTTVKLQLPDGVKVLGEWEQLPGLPSRNNPREKIYVGAATFSCKVAAANAADVKVGIVVKYEVCDADHCLPVSTLSTTVSLE